MTKVVLFKDGQTKETDRRRYERFLDFVALPQTSNWLLIHPRVIAFTLAVETTKTALIKWPSLSERPFLQRFHCPVKDIFRNP